MEQSNRKEHWENVYQNKQPAEVSWYQPNPETSLRLIEETNIAKDAAIIDIGGGDSFLADCLLELGFSNITVLDISQKAIERAKTRLGSKADNVKWIVADISQFIPTEEYQVWHDRATFHFLTNETDINNYKESVVKGLRKGGYLILGTFSDQGPEKCSGLEITQYNETSMTHSFAAAFDKLKCFTEDHPTPFDTVQNFIFCIFKKR